MNFKKIIATALLAALPVGTAFAHGQIWVDDTANVPKYKKLVIFPLAVKGSEYDYLLSEDESSAVYRMNDYLDKKFVRKLKYVTVDLGSPLRENEQIRADIGKYKPLYERFATEEERGRAAFDITMADAYLVPIIRENRVEEHISPATYVDVAMSTWTEERNGPNGDRTYNVRNWIEHHLIPEKLMQLRHMALEHTMYGDDGRKVLTSVNNGHVYFISTQKMFEDLIDEFRKDINDVKKNGGKTKGDGGATIAFEPLSVTSNVGDEFVQRAASYAVINGAGRIKGARLVYDRKSVANGADYIVKGSVGQWNETRSWVPPQATTSISLIDTHKEKWRDSKGNEHEKTVSRYKTVINDHFGHYVYQANVGATLNLTDAKTGKILVSYSGYDSDDKNGDAARHVAKNFCKRVEKYLSGDTSPVEDEKPKKRSSHKGGGNFMSALGGLLGALSRA